jgi:hypothetical protein
MALPVTFPIAVEQTLPDRIQFNLLGEIDSRIRFSDIRRALVKGGVAALRQQSLLEADALRRINDLGIILSISQPRGTRLCNIRISINPLRQLHRQRIEADYADERGVAAAVNWLHTDDTSDSNASILAFTARLIDDALLAVSRALEAACARLGVVDGFLMRSFALATVEVAIDIASTDPGRLVLQFAPGFNAYFREIVTRHYEGVAASREVVSEGARMIDARRGAGERYKFYEKTNRRVRFEVEFSREAFRRLSIDRHIPNGLIFLRVFNELAREAVTHFNVVAARSRVLVEAHDAGTNSALEFLIVLCRDVRRVPLTLELLRSIIRTGRVTATSDRPMLRRLIRDGLMERSCRGVYVPTARFSGALRVLRRIDEQSSQHG